MLDALDTASIAGRVVNGSGDPVLADVTPQRLDREAWNQGKLTVFTDTDGYFLFPRIEAGTYEFLLRKRGAPGGAGTANGRVTVADGQKLGNVRLILETGGTKFSGTVYTSDGVPMRSYTIRAENQSSDSEGLVTSTRTDNNGYFEIENVRDGDVYQLWGTNRSQSWSQSVSAGEHVEIVLPAESE